jgi:DNA-binding NarL/FixJ family response regulator
MTSNDLTVARLASLVGDLGEALAAFDRARQRMERQQQRPLIAIVDYDEAQARVLRGAAGAPELLRSAQAKFEDLGMTVWSERAERARGAGRRLAGGLTRREAEVLRLLAGGMTNRQIADALVLSVHTVERHINNIYGKIGAHNRAEAAAYAIRHEI